MILVIGRKVDDLMVNECETLLRRRWVLSEHVAFHANLVSSARIKSLGAACPVQDCDFRKALNNAFKQRFSDVFVEVLLMVDFYRDLKLSEPGWSRLSNSN